MIGKLALAVTCLLFVSGLQAQNGTVSPYSYFGIGDIRPKATVENQMMGGIGVYADSIHVNLQNPAAFSQLGMALTEGEHTITTYTAGVSHNELRLTSFTDEQSASVTNLDYLALGLSLKKGFGLGFGIKPVSSVGYNLVDESTNANGATVINQYTGEGGLNKVFLSAGYELAKNVSIGVSLNFNFGSIENRRVQSVEGVQFGTLDQRTSSINGWDLNYALNYVPALDENHHLYVSARVNTQANLSTRNTQEIGSFSVNNGQNIEIIDVDLESQGLRTTGLKIPTTATLGLGYGKDRKWFVGAEYSYQDLSANSNEFLAYENIRYQSASRLALGAFFIPEYSSFESYIKRITYRAGIHVDNSGIIVNDVPLKDFGITFGLGLPMGRNLSNLNLGFELGRRGTSRADLIEESYLKVNIGLSLNDFWFQKRKIN